MAEPTPIEPRDPGAPIARTEIDPDLIKLSRTKLKIGAITCAGVVFLCAMFLLRLAPDRRFAGASTTPRDVSATNIATGMIATDALVRVDADIIVSQAIRASAAKGSLGLRVAPVRNTGNVVWIGAPGDGWEAASASGYIGRLRRLDDMPFADAVRAFASTHPRPVFATVAAVRAGAASGDVKTVSGDVVHVADGDKVSVDLIEPSTATIVATFNERLPDAAAWTAALAKAGIAPTATGTPDPALGQVRFAVAAPAAETTKKLEAAELWAARVEPTTRHIESTWSVLRASPAGALAVSEAKIPDAQLELVGLDVVQQIPSDAYIVVMGEHPDQYWHVMPITIALVVIGLVFAWALFRAIRRDWLPART